MAFNSSHIYDRISIMRANNETLRGCFDDSMTQWFWRQNWLTAKIRGNHFIGIDSSLRTNRLPFNGTAVWKLVHRIWENGY